MLQAEVGEIPEDVQALTGRDVPVSALLYFSEDPRLKESASEENKNQTYNNLTFHSTVKFKLNYLASKHGVIPPGCDSMWV